MLQFSLVFMASLMFANIEENKTLILKFNNQRTLNLFQFMLGCTLIVFAGLRKNFNDTAAYIGGFEESPKLGRFFANPENFQLLENPLFRLVNSLVKSVTDNYHIFILLITTIVISLLIRFIRKYSVSYTFSILMFFATGLFAFTMAAMKQTLAMAILTLAIDQLLKHRILRFYLILILAMMFHTYAIVLAVLPLLLVKPWKIRTYLILIGFFGVFYGFESIITTYIGYSNDIGKAVYAYDVFDGNQVNVFRVLVYSVIPILSFMLRGHFNNQTRKENLFVHMSLLSFGFMLLGLNSAANLFARVSTYFEIGSILVLPWLIKQGFKQNSKQVMFVLSGSLYSVYFFYTYMIAYKFDDLFQRITIIDFFQTIF